jgi:hypothetical protein
LLAQFIFIPSETRCMFKMKKERVAIQNFSLNSYALELLQCIDLKAMKFVSFDI